VGISEEEAQEDWITNGEGVSLVPSGTFGNTHLKARWGAPVWTLNELRTIANVMETMYGIECDRFPKPSHLSFLS